MTAILKRYQDSCFEFDSLLTYGIALIEAQKGFTPNNMLENYGEKIFTKLICHAITLKNLSPSPSPNDIPTLWDVSSNYAIARTLIETYEALAYISFEPISEIERDFRFSLWNLHADERRFEMLRLIGSVNPEIIEIIEIQKRITEMRKSILMHAYLPKIKDATIQRIKKNDTPPYHLTLAERDERSGIDNNYHKSVIMNLSSHIHTHPFSIQQLFLFEAGDPESLRLMSIAINYSAAFLAKSIDGMIQLFNPRTPAVSESLRILLDRWSELLRNGLRNVY